MAATPDEIRDALADRLITGNAEEQIADVRRRKFSPKEIIDAARELGADAASRGPFVRVGFKGRSL